MLTADGFHLYSLKVLGLPSASLLMAMASSMAICVGASSILMSMRRHVSVNLFASHLFDLLFCLFRFEGPGVVVVGAGGPLVVEGAVACGAARGHEGGAVFEGLGEVRGAVAGYAAVL